MVSVMDWVMVLVFLNHDFGGLDHHAHRIALLQRQFFHAGAGDDTLDQIVTHLHHNVGHDAPDLDLFYDALELIPCGKCHIIKSLRMKSYHCSGPGSREACPAISSFKTLS